MGAAQSARSRSWVHSAGAILTVPAARQHPHHPRSRGNAARNCAGRFRGDACMSAWSGLGTRRNPAGWAGT